MTGAWRPKHVEWLYRNKTCTVLHQVRVLFDLHYDARKHKNKKFVITSALDTVTNRLFGVPDERNTSTITKLDPLWISYIPRELPCRDRYLWPNWSIHVSLNIAFVKHRKRNIKWSNLRTTYVNNRNREFVDVMVSWKIIGADVTNSVEWFFR